MLSELTSCQYQELLAFFRVDREDRQEREEIARERNLRQWFDRKLAAQNRESNG